MKIATKGYGDGKTKGTWRWQRKVEDGNEKTCRWPRKVMEMATKGRGDCNERTWGWQRKDIEMATKGHVDGRKGTWRWQRKDVDMATKGHGDGNERRHIMNVRFEEVILLEIVLCLLA